MMEVMQEHELWGNRGTYENHLVAAVLNADSNEGLFGASVAEIVAVAWEAENPGPDTHFDWTDVFAMVAAMNESGKCFLNAHGFCGDGYVNNEFGECVPACDGGERWDVCAEECKPKNDVSVTWEDYFTNPDACKGS